MTRIVSDFFRSELPSLDTEDARLEAYALAARALRTIELLVPSAALSGMAWLGTEKLPTPEELFREGLGYRSLLARYPPATVPHDALTAVIATLDTRRYLQVAPPTVAAKTRRSLVHSFAAYTRSLYGHFPLQEPQLITSYLNEFERMVEGWDPRSAGRPLPLL